jgi:secreted trypsin-like serine protease
MKTKAIGVLALILLFSSLTPAQAIEGGSDATADNYVIAIYNEDLGSTCSGALIAPKVIVTVAHCVVDKNGLPSKKVWVGSPGDSKDSALSRQNIVESIALSPDYSGGANGNVTDNDIAFVIPQNEFYQKNVVRLASSVENASLKASQVPLRVYGYGKTDNTVDKDDKFPKSFTGNYTTSISSRYPNSGYVKSTVGRACKGDSGGPVFYITASRTVLMGVASGVSLDVNCAKKESDGSYQTMFTEISKYANLAFEASAYAANSTRSNVAAENAEYQATIVELKTLGEELNNENSRLISCLTSAKKIIKTKKGKLAKGC